MDLGLKGNGVIVTGASSGIGRAIALEFGNEGANLAICARGREALEKTRSELEAKGVKAYAQVCDVSDVAALDQFLESAKSNLRQIDVLVNNAPGWGVSDDETGWARSFSVDIMASVRASWKVVPWMEDHGGGAIIHVSSIAGMEAGWAPPYAAAKAALISHAKTMANILAPKSIRVNCVALGSIEFPGGRWEQSKKKEPQWYEAIKRSIPFGRLGTPEEVAAGVVFLSSSRASWISGVTMAIDGVQHKSNL